MAVDLVAKADKDADFFLLTLFSFFATLSVMTILDAGDSDLLSTVAA